MLCDCCTKFYARRAFVFLTVESMSMSIEPTYLFTNLLFLCFVLCFSMFVGISGIGVFFFSRSNDNSAVASKPRPKPIPSPKKLIEI